MVKNSGLYPSVVVKSGDVPAVGLAGARLLTETIRVTSLDASLSKALSWWRGSWAVHDPGKIMADLAVCVALGGRCLSDVALLRCQGEVFGPVASDPTVCRLVGTLADHVEAVEAVVNRARTGAKFADGTSEMKDVIALTDAIARQITNLQVAAEANAMPQKYVVGASAKDFMDEKGNPIPTWQSYFTSVWGITSKDAKAGTFTAASLDNFHSSVNHMFKWAAAVLGLPLRYAAQDTNQPAAEGAIRADESRLIKNCERKQTAFGNALGSLMGMALYVAEGGAVDVDRIATTWYDAGTPTYAQRADATQKLAAGVPILSREGAWEEMGWSPDRMEIERRRFAAQEADPFLDRLSEKIGNVT